MQWYCKRDWFVIFVRIDEKSPNIIGVQSYYLVGSLGRRYGFSLCGTLPVNTSANCCSAHNRDFLLGRWRVPFLDALIGRTFNCLFLFCGMSEASRCYISHTSNHWDWIALLWGNLWMLILPQWPLLTFFFRFQRFPPWIWVGFYHSRWFLFGLCSCSKFSSLPKIKLRASALTCSIFNLFVQPIILFPISRKFEKTYIPFPRLPITKPHSTPSRAYSD